MAHTDQSDDGDRRPTLKRLLQTQDGVISRAQALPLLGRRALAHRLREGGPWQRLLPGVYGAFTGTPTDQQRARAALLYAGKTAFVTGFTACLMHGLSARPRCRHMHGSRLDVPMPRRMRAQVPIGGGRLRVTGCSHVHVAITEGRRACTDFTCVERTKRHASPVYLQSWPGTAVAPLPRALIDAALRMDDLGDVRALLAEGVQRHSVSAWQLQRELDASPQQGSGLARWVIEEVLLGARSGPEGEFVRLARKSKVLPAMHHNCSLIGPNGEFLGKPDGYIEESGVAQEIDSVRWHMDPALWAATMDRRSRMEAAGVRVLSAAPSRQRSDPVGMLRNLEDAHRIGLVTGPPPGLGVRCRPGCPLARNPTASP